MKKFFNYFMKVCIITAIISNFIILCFPIESLIYKPRKLKELFSGGITVVNTYKGFDLLYLKTKPLTADQRERIVRLKSLGYVGGSFEIEGINPVLMIPVNLAEINEIIINTSSIKKHNFSIRLAINNYREECRYHMEWAKDALINHLKENKGAVIFKPDLHDIEESIIISLEFKSCDMSIKEVQIR